MQLSLDQKLLLLICKSNLCHYGELGRWQTVPGKLPKKRHQLHVELTPRGQKVLLLKHDLYPGARVSGASLRRSEVRRQTQRRS